MEYVDALQTRPIAVETATANAQYYEVGTSILQGMLGPRMKYSACLYPHGHESLDQAEKAMLGSYVEKAQLKDGQRILDLGCGWGECSIFLASILPQSHVVAFSNSQSQRAYIDARTHAHQLRNFQVVTGDIVEYEFEPDSSDRIVSVKLFEHMKNYQQLMAKIARALTPEGKLFVHLFSHRTSPYHFEEGWMTTHFFTGGTMPSADLLLYFPNDLKINRQWWINGQHYSKTCEDWLSNMIANKNEIWPHIIDTYGQENARKWYNRWQVFYLACSELFAYEGGDTWAVSQYLFEKPEM